MTKIFYITFIFSFAFISIQAQDIHFSHIHASPILLNPAMTGMFDGGDVRLIANSRVQWENFTNGYKTVAASIDSKIFQLDESSVLSGGIQMFSDKAGDLGFSTTSASMNLAVTKAFDRRGNNALSLGLQGAMYTNKFDVSKMKGHEMDLLVMNGMPSKINYWDISAGLAWNYTIDRNNYYYIGASLFHINQPNVSFSGFEARDPNYDMESTGKILFRKKVIHGGGQFRLAKYTTALPSVIWMDQGPHQEFKAGSFFKFMKDRSFKKSSKAFYMGAWLRWYVEKDIAGVDALDLSFRYDHNQTIITISFDMNISTLKRASNGFGGPEFSIIQIIGSKKTRFKSNRVKCPAM